MPLNGDYKNLNKTFALLKCFAAYNMVIVQGTLLFSYRIPIHYPNVTFEWIAVFRAFAAILLPLFAGVYLRTKLGPFLKTKQLPPNWLKEGFEFLLIAILLEGLRLSSLSYNLNYFFNWQALEFIALAMLITYGLLKIHKYAIYVAAILVMFLRPWVSRWLENFDFSISTLNSSQLYLVSWIWSISLSLLLFLTFFILLKAPFFKRRAQAKQILFATGILGCFLLALFYQPVILLDHRALQSFINLPYALLLPTSHGDHYWPLIVFYPVVVFGYFLREFLFDLKYRKYFLSFSLLTAVYFIYFLVAPLKDFLSALDINNVFTTELFRINPPLMLGLLSGFYLAVLMVHLLIKGRSLKWVDSFCYYSRSVLVIYLTHPIIAVVFRDLFPFEITDKLGSSEMSRYLIILGVLHLVYFVSLIISHNVARLFERKLS